MNIQNRDNFFTAGAHAIKKTKIFCPCSRFKTTIPQLFSTIEIVSVVVTNHKQTIFLFNNLNIFPMNSNSNSFIRVQVRVQKKYFFEFKFGKNDRVLSSSQPCFLHSCPTHSKKFLFPLFHNLFVVDRHK